MPRPSHLDVRFPPAFLIPLIIICLSGAAPAAAATFHYDGMIAGVKVATASVQVDRDVSTYRISGNAATNGVARLLSDWTSEFYAEGGIEHERAKLRRYGYDEHEGKRHHILSLDNGQVTQTRNGRARPPRPALDGLDVLSAFFVEGGCWARRVLHTGRHAYLLEGRPSTHRESCDFRITDDDGDRNRVQVTFGVREGLTIPVRVVLQGWPGGRVVLREIDGGVEVATLGSRSGADGSRSSPVDSGVRFLGHGR